MKKLASIVQEVPHIKEAIQHYIHCCEKEIKNCQHKVKELETAIGIAKERLEKFNEHKPTDLDRLSQEGLPTQGGGRALPAEEHHVAEGVVCAEGVSEPNKMDA